MAVVREAEGRCDGVVLLDALADLVTGAHCLGCARAGRLLCRRCTDTLPSVAFPARPVPCPPGLAPVWSAAEYAGPVATMVVGHKDRQQHALAAPLGGLLAVAVAAAVTAPREQGAGQRQAPVLLVPVPSAPATVRSRGYDALAAVVRVAARRLRGQGYDVHPAPVLRQRGAVRDQAGLAAVDRAVNLAGSLACDSARLGRLARQWPSAHVVVCDDVVTTGATAREAQRALACCGLTIRGVATCAATRRRTYHGAISPG